MTHEILALEQAAMARWCNGDPDGFLEISAEDVNYFDPFIARRIDRLSSLRAHYDALRGQIFLKPAGRRSSSSIAITEALQLVV